MVSKPDSSLPSSTNSTPTPSNYNKHSSRKQASIAPTTTTTIERTPRSTYHRQHASQTMSSPQGSPQGPVGQSYMLVPNLHVPDPTMDEIELDNTNAWMVATVIEDDDLMFGGKPLSAWYEEDRRRLSSSNEDEEEIRGRQRDPVRPDAHYQHRHQHSHHQPQLQHHHHYQHHTVHHPHVAHTHHNTKKTGEIKH
ncbi:hypothetical protein QR685DRAFT_148362 [Neurospora intermedia]|uniref:Uncharacterized protein n=1 Tax=Neurospora intermedia TaxID=5142 RepID=A0ABR3CXB6_NEUIN